jgi:glutamine amidotransferase-like uncharacterized protein
MRPAKVLVYCDEGVGSRSLQQTIKSFKDIQISPKLVDRHHFFNASKIEADLLVLPGGRDVFYQTALQGEPNKKILAFVENGGNYLGLCAGAYYACAIIEFEKNGPLEVLGNRELKFFPGKAIGPAYGNGRFDYLDVRGAQLSNLQVTDGQIFRSYYNGGCFFEHAETYSNVEILTRYSDIEGKPASIIECRVGSGKVILSGIHPEYSSRFLEKSEDPYLQKLIPQLEVIEQERKELFTHLIDRLSI